ncbi:MAG: hypothetical protein AAF368_09975, partial [Planctomycetota bacterium]
ALFALLASPSAEEDAVPVERWGAVASQAVADRVGSEPQVFLDAIEAAVSLRPPYRQELLRQLATLLKPSENEGLLGARALVESARVGAAGSEFAFEPIDEELLLAGFLAPLSVPLSGQRQRTLPRSARRRLQRAAVKAQGRSLAVPLFEKARALAVDPAAAEGEAVSFCLECVLDVLPAEEVARESVGEALPEEWWSTFFDLVRGRAWAFEEGVLDAWLASEASADLRWEALRALVASWAADAPQVRARFDEVLLGEDRELALDLFGLLARAQHGLTGEAWEAADEVLFRAWQADDRPWEERVAELDPLSRSAPHEAFQPELLSLLNDHPEACTASVFELAADLITAEERQQPSSEGVAEALRALLRRDVRELQRAAQAGEKVRAIETRLLHQLRAQARGKSFGWRRDLLQGLEVAEAVESEDVGKTAAALLAKSGAEGLELLRGALPKIDVIRLRLEILLGLTQAAESLGVETAADAALELRERYASCDEELKLRILRALGVVVRAAGCPASDVAESARFLSRRALDGAPASQLKTAAV